MSRYFIAGKRFHWLLAVLALAAMPSRAFMQVPDPGSANAQYQEGAYAEAAASYLALAEHWKRHNRDSAYFYQMRSAKSHNQAYDFDRGLPALRRLVAAHPAPAPAIVCEAAVHLAHGYFMLQQFDSAMFFVNKSLEVSARISQPSPVIRAKAHELKALVYLYTDETAAARAWIKKAHAIRKQGLPPDDMDLAYSSNTLYLVLSEIGDMKAAGAAIHEAWDIFSKKLPAEHPHVAVAANNLAAYLMDAGDVACARDLLLHAASSHEAAGRRQPLIENYVNLARIYAARADYSTALAYSARAWELAVELLSFPHQTRANILDGMGASYFELGNLTVADSCYRLAFREREVLHQASSNLSGLAQSAYNLGKLARAQNDLPAARAAFAKAARWWRQTNPDDFKWANATYELAELDWEAGHTTRAIAGWEACLVAYRAALGSYHPYVAETLISLAQAASDPGQARTYADQAWAAVGHTPYLGRFPDTLPLQEFHPVVFSLADWELKQVLSATSPKPAAWRRAQYTGRSMLDWLPDYQAWYVASSALGRKAKGAQAFYGQLALACALALQAGAPDPRAWENMLLECMEARRGESIRATLRQRQSLAFAGVPDSLVQRARRLEEGIRFLNLRLTEEEDPYLRSQMATFSTQWQLLQAQLRDRYPAYYAAQYAGSRTNLLQVLQTLRPSEALAAFLDLDSLLLAVTLQGSRMEVRLLRPQLGWRDSVGQYRVVLRASSLNQRAVGLAHFLYRELWAPLDLGKAGKVRILPDGPLYGVPFETLLESLPRREDPVSRWPYLLRRHSIYVSHSLLPAYPPGGAQRGLVRAVVPGYSDEMKAEYLQRLPLGRGPDQMFLDWLPTPWSADFAQDIARNGWGEAVTGLGATMASFRKSAGRQGVLHIGAHARFDPGDPLRSFLALAPDPINDDAGYLYLYALYNETFQTQLAVLTACETGEGPYAAGEGLLSLAHAFNYAGCPSVVHSLWPIDDEQSNALCRLFYKRLREGLPVSDALRLAKIDYLDHYDGPLAAPYYWAGFAVLGEDIRLLAPVSRPWLLVWAIAGAGVVLLGAAWFWRRKGRPLQKS